MGIKTIISTIKNVFVKKKEPDYTIVVSGTPAGQTRTTTGETVSTPGTQATPGVTFGGGGGGGRAGGGWRDTSGGTSLPPITQPTKTAGGFTGSVEEISGGKAIAGKQYIGGEQVSSWQNYPGGQGLFLNINKPYSMQLATGETITGTPTGKYVGEKGTRPGYGSISISEPEPLISYEEVSGFTSQAQQYQAQPFLSVSEAPSFWGQYGEWRETRPFFLGTLLFAGEKVSGYLSQQTGLFGGRQESMAKLGKTTTLIAPFYVPVIGAGLALGVGVETLLGKKGRESVFETSRFVKEKTGIPTLITTTAQFGFAGLMVYTGGKGLVTDIEKLSGLPKTTTNILGTQQQVTKKQIITDVAFEQKTQRLFGTQKDIGLSRTYTDILKTTGGGTQLGESFTIGTMGRRGFVFPTAKEKIIITEFKSLSRGLSTPAPVTEGIYFKGLFPNYPITSISKTTEGSMQVFAGKSFVGKDVITTPNKYLKGGDFFGVGGAIPKTEQVTEIFGKSALFKQDVIVTKLTDIGKSLQRGGGGKFTGLIAKRETVVSFDILGGEGISLKANLNQVLKQQAISRTGGALSSVGKITQQTSFIPKIPQSAVGLTQISRGVVETGFRQPSAFAGTGLYERTMTPKNIAEMIITTKGMDQGEVVGDIGKNVFQGMREDLMGSKISLGGKGNRFQGLDYGIESRYKGLDSDNVFGGLNSELVSKGKQKDFIVTTTKIFQPTKTQERLAGGSMFKQTSMTIQKPFQDIVGRLKMKEIIEQKPKQKQIYDVGFGNYYPQGYTPFKWGVLPLIPFPTGIPIYGKGRAKSRRRLKRTPSYGFLTLQSMGFKIPKLSKELEETGLFGRKYTGRQILGNL